MKDKLKTAQTDGSLAPKELNDDIIIPPTCQDCGIPGCPYDLPTNNNEELKTCIRCHEAKPLETSFYKNKVVGYLNSCMVCYRETVRAYNRTESGKKVIRKHTAKMLINHRTKHNAGALLRYHVKVGNIQKPTTCEHCHQVKTPSEIQGHHSDYSKPLDVMWLCRLCHQIQHGKIIDKTLIKGATS